MASNSLVSKANKLTWYTVIESELGAMIEVKNIWKTYGKKQNAFQALKNVSFTLETGSTLAIVGKSGSGKSTLMHVMAGLDMPQEGEVLIGGRNILAYRRKKLDQFRSSTMGFVFQSYYVSSGESCYNTVSLPLEIAKVPRARRKKLILDALNKVELADKVNERAANLSGGQKQRLAVARAVVNSPELLFADEPTGNLDSATGEKVIQLLFDLNRQIGTTLIIVTHDPDLAKRCDVQIIIKDGTIEAIKKSAKKPRRKIV